MEKTKIESRLAVVDTGEVNQDGVVREGAFFRKDITAVEFDTAIKSIGTHAFAECVNLKKVEIPEGVTTIEACAFEGCIGLKEIVLPSTLTNIDVMAFAHCSSLKRIVIPNSVFKIGMCAFEGCSALKSIVFQEADEEDEKKTQLHIADGAFGYCDALTEVEFPDRTVEFVANACSGKNLETIVLPAMVKIPRQECVGIANSRTKVRFRMWSVIFTHNRIPQKNEAYETLELAKNAVNKEMGKIQSEDITYGSSGQLTLGEKTFEAYVDCGAITKRWTILPITVPYIS